MVCKTKKTPMSPDPFSSQRVGTGDGDYGDIGVISWSCTPSHDSLQLNVLILSCASSAFM